MKRGQVKKPVIITKPPSNVKMMEVLIEQPKSTNVSTPVLVGCTGTHSDTYLVGPTGATGPTGPCGASLSFTTGCTGTVSILTTSTDNCLVNDLNLTYTRETETLNVGTEETGKIVTSRLKLNKLENKNGVVDFAYNKYLVADDTGNIGFIRGANYQGVEYRDTSTFNFINPMSPNGLLLTENNAYCAVFIQQPTMGIKNISFAANYTGKDNSYQVEIVNLTNTTSTSGELSLVNNVISPPDTYTGNNIIKVDMKNTYNDPAFSRTGYPRVLGIRVKANTSTVNPIYLLSVIICYGI